MKERLLNVGFGNAVVAERIVAFVSPNTSPSRRMREEARKQNMLI
ncbi:MAG: extracellular matrix/biofilm biosynthesis regulator RemA family protein, partial [Desulfatiglandales bacterium]